MVRGWIVLLLNSSSALSVAPKAVAVPTAAAAAPLMLLLEFASTSTGHLIFITRSVLLVGKFELS